MGKEASMRPQRQTFQLDKMGCYLIFSNFDKGEPFSLPADLDLAFTITDAQGNHEAVKTIDPKTSQESLGVWIAPDGNNTDHINILQHKASKW